METISWSAIGAIAGVAALIHAVFLVPLLGAVRWLLDRTRAEEDKALTSRFDAVDEKIESLRGQTARIDRVDDRVQANADRLAELKATMAQEYIHREDWVRVEGGRDVSMRHLREDISSLKQDVAKISERL